MTYLLRDTQLFETLNERDLADLVHFMHERRFASGETLCTRGQYGNTMIIVVQGALSAVVPGVDNTPREIAHLGQGGVLGEMFCIDPAPRPATVVASEETTVLELGREDLVRMRQQAPHAAAALVSAVFHNVLKRLRNVNDRIERDLCPETSLHPNDGSGVTRTARAEMPDPWEECFSRSRGSA
jgi:CRP/FNR family transcriptional regulator, cyclic AMP receptor protein